MEPGIWKRVAMVVAFCPKRNKKTLQKILIVSIDGFWRHPLVKRNPAFFTDVPLTPASTTTVRQPPWK